MCVTELDLLITVDQLHCNHAYMYQAVSISHFSTIQQTQLKMETIFLYFFFTFLFTVFYPEILVHARFTTGMWVMIWVAQYSVLYQYIICTHAKRSTFLAKQMVGLLLMNIKVKSSFEECLANPTIHLHVLKDLSTFSKCP